MRSLRGSFSRRLSARITTSISQSSSLTSYRSMASMRPLAKASSAKEDYTKWTKEALIKQIQLVEAELRQRPPPPPSPRKDDQIENPTSQESTPAKKPKAKKVPDPSRHATRYIALKLAYLGRNYSGFEFSASGNEPSIEEELYKALAKTCLIFPEDPKVFDLASPDCEYSKCGRTDRGVSAFGQVIGLRVRSARPVAKSKKKTNAPEAEGQAAAVTETEEANQDVSVEEEELPPWDHIRDEISYPKALNRVLPPDIRILAWCPSPPPDFSARFSCSERQYRYFFTQPAFSPPSAYSGSDRTQPHPGWLDLEAMRDAAGRFVGEHDFRNFCKIDPNKALTNFSRVIHEADILPASDMSSALPFLQQSSGGSGLTTTTEQLPQVYYFKVRGTAFLWHQIRHMVSILFLVGQGLEKPAIIDELLDIQRTPRRPTYPMADEVPLVLWDCVFHGDAPDGGLPWVYALNDRDRSGSKKAAPQSSPIDEAWRYWRERKMDEILSNGLLRLVAEGGPSSVESQPASAMDVDPLPEQDQSQTKQKKQKKGDSGPPPPSVKLFEGGDQSRPGGKYVPVMKLRLMDTPDELNDKFAKRKGFADAEDMRRDRALKWEQKNSGTAPPTEE